MRSHRAFIEMFILLLAAVLCAANAYSEDNSGAQEATAEVNGVRLHYKIVGNGPPLVLVHGWASNSLCWDDQVPAFQKGFRVLRYDRRGFGKSSGLPDITADPADLDALLEHLSIRSAIILGHSQGGYVALGFVQNYPQRVSALILYGAAPPDGFGVPWSGPDAWPLAQLKDVARTKGVEAIWEVLANHPLITGDQLSPEAQARVQKIRGMYSGADLRNDLPQSGQTARPTMARTVDINVPTLVITGEKEMPYYRLAGDALAYAIPNASRVVLKNGGHRVNASQPAAFNAAVLEFLNKRKIEVEHFVKPLPAPTTILKHATALYTSLAFYAGMQLDIFTVMDKHSMTAIEAAVALRTKPAFVERLLYALAACDLLEVKDGVFSNLAEASRYLVKGKSGYLGEHVLVNSNLMQYMISGGLKTPESVMKGEAAEKYDYSKTSYDTWLQIFRGTMPVAVKAGEALSAKFDFGRFKTVADVGGASGGLATALLKAYPHLKATVTDLPSITPVSRALLKEQNAAGIDVEDWDVLAGPSPKPFDAVILRALVQVLSPDQARQAVINVGKSVNPGGSIYILGHIVDDSRTSPPEEVAWYLLNMNWEDQAGFYAEKDYRRMLQDAGFKDIRRDVLANGDGIIFAVKSPT